ncbi:fumarate hydratase [Slackia heliotrinireducens]|uniref:Fumarase alpha subunit n=1 Tax=Slackia heliotrinireducens (strain ATCC 29202 / DSM 20476 / NCTC 11029 / RHS 1) TaxID=471855 RepID=C7N3H2_SLAHD|nr:fumarate hydratase [Slackia heliotrinireducens]ACV23695.1 fumarase alpha subunit [Slackia heliotrinireducens DSM 20476]VEH03257.1 L(+)-tartrate dehydratase subunit alpha [Slackia heliotrinireducens]
MKEISTATITEEVARLCIEAACDLPVDVEKLIQEATDKEESEFGKYAMEKVCKNVKIARETNVPMCQDTGMVIVFAEIGQEVHITGGSFEDAVNAGVAKGYIDGYLRKSTVIDPVLNRKNAGDNTPAIIYARLVPGDELSITIMPKGAGSENMSQLKMLKPAQGLEGIKQFVIDSVVNAGGNPCPPTIVGVGIGGNADKAMQLSKEALRREAGAPNPNPEYAKLEQELLEAINKSGVGPQGFGGRTTALAVHIETYPTHIATMPVGVTLNCHAARHKHVVL